LETVTFVKRLLYRVERRIGRGESLDRRDLVTLRLDGKHQARPDGSPVEQDGAAPTHSVLAADVSSGQAEVVAQMIRQQSARICGWRVVDAVDSHAAKTFAVRTFTR
jgi:hypothetical protein